jgi:hypothetical protein
MTIKVNKSVKEQIGPDAFLKWIAVPENALMLYNMGDVAGRWIEKIIEQKEGTNTNQLGNQNTHGYDVLRYKDGLLKKAEIKTTSTVVTTKSTRKHNTCYMKVGGLEDKRTKCHEIIIIDKVNFHRFCIPHDVFFNEGSFYGEGKTLSFRWYADYDEDKTLQKTKRNLLDDGTYKLRSEPMSNNTKLLKKYQILN